MKLELDSIKNQLSPEVQEKISCIEILSTIDSTNDYLLKRIFENSKIPRICLAEQQTAGKGRRGRHWYSPYGRNIYFSLLWRFPLDQQQLQGLSIVIGVAILKTLQLYGGSFDQLFLKWPNDVYYRQNKLAGVLIETRNELHDHCKAVIGIGINANMTEIGFQEIQNPWTSLQKVMNQPIDRNRLAALLINQVIEQIELFSCEGLNPFIQHWQSRDLSLNLG